jgi:hypothetical protein
VSRREKEGIDRLERNGTMDRRREQIRRWSGTHPGASALDAVRALRYPYPDHMHIIAGSIRIDLAAAGAAGKLSASRNATPVE